MINDTSYQAALSEEALRLFNAGDIRYVEVLRTLRDSLREERDDDLDCTEIRK